MGELSIAGMAYLFGGPKAAVRSALAALYVRGAVRPARLGTVERGQTTPPDDADPLERTVYNNIVMTVSVRELAARRRVIEALEVVRRDLIARGLLRPRWFRLVVPLAVLGPPVYLVVRLEAVSLSVGAVLALLIAIVAAGFATRRTIHGYRTQRALLRWHADLTPDEQTGREREGRDRLDEHPEDVAVAVALFGPAALWSLLPRFTVAAGLLYGGHDETSRQPSDGGTNLTDWLSVNNQSW